MLIAEGWASPCDNGPAEADDSGIPKIPDE
jgi:hypothetical protein